MNETVLSASVLRSNPVVLRQIILRVLYTIRKLSREKRSGSRNRTGDNSPTQATGRNGCTAVPPRIHNTEQGCFAESALHLFDQFGKHCRFVNRHVSQDFSIEFDSLFLETAHEFAVGRSVHTGRGIDSNDPERTEITLFPLPIPVGIGTPTPEGIMSGTDTVFPLSKLSGSGLKYFFSSAPRSDSGFCSWHFISPSTANHVSRRSRNPIPLSRLIAPRDLGKQG